MREWNEGVRQLIGAVLGTAQATALLGKLEPMLDGAHDGSAIDRSQFSAAMNALLFLDLLDRVPSGAAYVADRIKIGVRVCFDHGAIRTIAMPSGDTGALPRGELAFRRILEPLGYEDAALYPLPRLRMTGRAYRHREHPETIPQFFLSELHVDQFDHSFAAAAGRVFGTSRDPLDEATKAVLARFGTGEAVEFDVAVAALPVVVGAFGRQHDRPMLDDYVVLKEASPEAAWIASEGNAFNHATDRVANVEVLAENQKRLGRPMKERVEVSTTGRVRQTAFRADMVERSFGVAGEADCTIMVPGSFYEFISRDADPETGALDLSFDSGNATGIFQMTKAAA